MVEAGAVVIEQHHVEIEVLGIDRWQVVELHDDGAGAIPRQALAGKPPIGHRARVSAVGPVISIHRASRSRSC
jgi:hypothetical protein